MIRRGFWLMTGAVAGIYGYRRVTAVGRRVSASLNASLNPAGPPRRRTAVTPGRMAREAFRFARDVREGMELYTARHDPPAGSTVTTDQKVTDHEAQPEDGR
jgi:hypothetical protein